MVKEALDAVTSEKKKDFGKKAFTIESRGKEKTSKILYIFSESSAAGGNLFSALSSSVEIKLNIISDTKTQNIKFQTFSEAYDQAGVWERAAAFILSSL